jgi:hypothetical protein
MPKAAAIRSVIAGVRSSLLVDIDDGEIPSRPASASSTSRMTADG